MTVSVVGARTGARRLVDASGVAVDVQAARDRPSDAKWTEKAQLGVTIAGFLATLAGLWFVRRQLRASAQEARAQRTADLAERRQGKEWDELWSRVGPWYLRVADLKDCMTRMRVWDEAASTASEMDARPDYGREQLPTLSDVFYFASLNEETGVMFNTENVDQRQMIRHFAEELVYGFDVAWWWIHWSRGNRLGAADPASPTDNETSLYAEWELMASSILDSRTDVEEELDPQPEAEIWVICMPTAKWDWDDDRRDAEWKRHEELSVALSVSMTDLQRLEDAVGASIADAENEPEGRVVCIPPWRSDRGDQERVQRIAEELDVRFSQDDGFARLEAVAAKLKKGASPSPAPRPSGPSPRPGR